MTTRPCGTCRTCRRRVSVRLDGTLAFHGASTMYDPHCRGSRGWPVHGSIDRGPRSELVHRAGDETVTVPAAVLDVALVGASIRTWFTESC